MNVIEKAHEKILSNLLSYVVKREDAPQSAETHLLAAVNELLLTPNY